MVSSVTIAILPREGFSHARRSLESLYTSSALAFEVVVIDGGSPWPVSAALRREARRRGFRLVRLERFLTPNAARNIALAHAKSDYIVFADNDLLYANGWLERLVETADATGAALVGPIVCAGDEGEPPFAEVHGARGIGNITEHAGRRSFQEHHPFVHQALAEVQRTVFTEPCELLEFHCLLARRDIFARIGAFDEELRSALEHVDLCFNVRRAGGLVYIEPRAVVHQILPPELPRGVLSLPYFIHRWKHASNHASLQHFCAKWQIPAGDPVIAAHAQWLRDRRWIVVTKFLAWLRRLGLPIAAGSGDR